MQDTINSELDVIITKAMRERTLSDTMIVNELQGRRRGVRTERRITRKEFCRMPIETDERLKNLLTEGRITAITLDTNVFDGQRLNFRSPTMRILAGLKDAPFPLILSTAVASEVRRHLVKAMDDSIRGMKKAAGEAIFAWDVQQPTREELLEQLTGGRTPEEAAAARFQEFLKHNNCEVLDDFKLVDTATIYGAYFSRRAPFGRGEKTEFPDALALNALERAAVERATSFLVVSADGDWRDFCEASSRLFLVTKLEKALSLLNDVPVGLRKAVVNWFAEGQGGQVEVAAAISNSIEALDVDVNAYAHSGEVETHAWAAEVRDVAWPDEQDIDIIETEALDGGTYRAVVSLPVMVTLRFCVELNFSLWDSIDRESISMGGRTEEVDRDEEARVTVTIDLHDVGKGTEYLELVATEIDMTWLDLDLGEVDMFEPADYDRLQD